MIQERCVSHKGPGRSCGGTICFSPPLLTLAWEAGRGGSTQRCKDNRGIPGNGVNLYLGDPGVDRYHLSIQRNTRSVSPSSWFHPLASSFCRSTPFVWFLMSGIPSYPLTLFLCSSSLNRSFLMDSLWMRQEVRRSVDNGLSDF